jgi:hypothetical protein
MKLDKSILRQPLCQFQQTQNKHDKNECGHELKSVPKDYQTITLS